MAAGEPSFYWYDYETFGTDPARDRPAQFAGLRTDLELNPLGSPTVLFCKPTPDYLPDPYACLITGITPQSALEKGLAESTFIGTINAQFAEPNTCVAGYNNIRFDDEMTRYTLYRNLLDPYAREWQHGNSRWDLIDVMRMACALRPEGIEWPVDAEGRPVFKLDRLTAANGIEHGNAHDALNDVLATIALARVLRDRQPRLFTFLLQHRGKQGAARLLGLGRMQPLLHASAKYPAERGCIAIVVALSRHPVNSNGIVVYDLSVDPTPLLTLSVEEARERLFTPRSELPEGVERIALKTVHINKCPALAPIGVLRRVDAERVGLDTGYCQANLKLLQQAEGLGEKIAAILGSHSGKEPEKDPDLMLYGGFISDRDRHALDRLRVLPPQELESVKADFGDSRLPELLFRYRARNFPDTLNATERGLWQEFCRDRLTGKLPGASLTRGEFEQRLSELAVTEISPERLAILADLRGYAQTFLP